MKILTKALPATHVLLCALFLLSVAILPPPPGSTRAIEVVPAASGPAAASAVPGRPRVRCRLDESGLAEISGMASSRVHPGVVWAHADSGSEPVVYAVRLRDCRIVARLRVTGVTAVDWEAMAAGSDARGRAVLWIADIGDNRAQRGDVALIRVREPDRLGDRTVRGQVWRIRYPGGPADAETLLTTPTGAPGWIVTKGLFADVLALPDPLPEPSPTRIVRARRVGSAPVFVTDGATSLAGDRIVLRDYVGAVITTSPPPGELLAEVELPRSPQGEAITFTADGRALLTTSEDDDRIWEVPVPAAALPDPDPTAEPTGDPTTAPTEPAPGTPTPSPPTTPVAVADDGAPLVVIGLGVVGVVLVGAAAVLRRRHQRVP